MRSVIGKVLTACAILLMLVSSYGCPIGWKVCQTGQECDVKQRCFENRCAEPPEEGNRPPIARAGVDQRVRMGVRIRLDGGQSSDVDLDRLTFTWSFKKRPSGSRAVFDNAKSPQASFVPDVPGEYQVKLTVVDALGLKDEDFVTIRVNHPPEASAGGDKLVLPNATVNLDASRSRDLDEDPLSYEWTLVERPSGSNSKLRGTNSVTTSFTVDKPGVYVAEVEVSDGLDTKKDRVVIQVTDPSQVKPVLKKLDPWKAPKRSIVVVTVMGDNFIQGAEVLFDENPLTTTYLSKERLQVKLDLKDSKLGAHKIKVRNPQGKTTEDLLFQVSEVPVPEIRSVSPDNVTAGTVLKATIRGTGFVSDAKVFFNGKVVASSYKDQSELTVTIPTTGLKEGSYDVVVENEKDKRSRPFAIRVTAIPPTPAITLVQPQPRVYEIGKVYEKMLIYARGLTSETQVWIDNKRYRGQIIRKINAGTTNSGTIELPRYSTVGLTEGKLGFQLKNISPGKTFTSSVYYIHLRDPNKLSLYSARFYMNGSSSIAATEQKYDYIDLRGVNFKTGIRVKVDGKPYQGSVRLLGSSSLRLEGFSTLGWSEGKHSFQVEQQVDGTTYKSNTYSLTFANGFVPMISSVRTSNSLLYTEREFTYVLVSGYFFRSDSVVIIDGVPYTGNSHVEKNNSIYLYKFSTKGWQPGSHTFLVRHTVKGKTYQSRLYNLTVSDGRTPRLTSLRTLPSGSLYVGDTYEITLTGSNILPGAVVLVDGIEYTKQVQISQTTVKIAKFETAGLQPRRYTIQVRNKINGNVFDSNGYSLYLRNRPSPRLYSVTPNPISARDTQITVTLNGSYLSTKTKLLLGGKDTPYKSVNTSRLIFDINPKTLGAGRYKVQVVNPDGRKSQELSLEIVPDLQPILWEVYPSDLFLYPTPTFSRTVRLRIAGFLLEPNALVLFDGKVIGKLANLRGNYAEVDVPTGIFTKSGVVSLTIKNSSGKESNKTELWIHRPQKPSIYSVSPDRLYQSTNPLTIRIYGRGFTAKSKVVFNGQELTTTFAPYISGGVSKVPYSGTLTALLQAGDVAQAPDVIKVTVKNADGSVSPVVEVVKYNSGTSSMTVYSAPASAFEGQVTPITYSIRGTRFTKTSKVFLDGKAVQTQYVSSSYLRVTYTLPPSLKAGEIAYWQVVDGTVRSQHKPMYIERAPRITTIQTPVIRKSDLSPIVKLVVTNVVPGTVLEFLGTTYPILNNGTVQILVLNEIGKAKEGIHLLNLKSASGAKSQTGAIHILP